LRTLARRLGLSALAEALLLTGRVRVRVTASVKTRPYDEALALRTEDAVRIALRTKKIIVHETGVADTIDPLGDADFVEALTDELECELQGKQIARVQGAASREPSSTASPPYARAPCATVSTSCPALVTPSAPTSSRAEHRPAEECGTPTPSHTSSEAESLSRRDAGPAALRST